MEKVSKLETQDYLKDIVKGRTVMLSLFDKSTIMCKPWAEAGHLAIAIDIQHKPGMQIDGNVVRVGADINHFLPPMANYVFVAAFPPCTNLAISGARWYREKGLRGLIEGLETVEAGRSICEWSGAPWLLENPVSTISTYWRKPDYKFHPWEYGGYDGGSNDGYTKNTCLWTSEDFIMPDKLPIPLAEDHDRIHKSPQSSLRSDRRNATPAGFAQAVWSANDQKKLH